MIYGSVCSGIEAATVAWHDLGWTPAWFSEIEEFPSAVLKFRYPGIPNIGDMTKVYDNEVFKSSKIDILVGGTPCQSFSLGGKRKGLDDPRGDLALEFLRIAREKKPRWIVWENVSGVLSSYGGTDSPDNMAEKYTEKSEFKDLETPDFKSFIEGLQELRYGFAWRVLDAQYFGVPQQRRRLFVIAHSSGDCRYPGAVLFNSEAFNYDRSRSDNEKRSIPILTTTTAGNSNARGVVVIEKDISRAGSSGFARCLTPEEEERRQGFPGNHTAIPWGSGIAPDSLRYKAIGNSMAIPVMQWIGKRIQFVDSLTQEKIMPNNFIPLYDLESLTEPQRQQYVSALCHHIGVPDNLNLVALTYLDETEGPARLVPYIKRGGAEMVRQSIGLDVKSLTDKMVGGSIVFTATGVNKDGRQEIAVGSKFVDGLIGNQLDDAVMTASTRALRRLALQFIGAGVLDESEVNQRKTIYVAPVPVPSQPIAEPSNEPGKDITPEPLLTAVPKLSGVSLIDHLPGEAKRLELIAQLNAQVEEPVKKTRKPRSPNKKKVDLGPSESPAAAPASSPAVEPETVIPAAHPVIAAPVVQASAPLTAPGVQSKPKLTADQVKPFRQRLFRLQNDYLEPNGFAPTEGMGNAQKMRAFAQVMFADIVSMNDLSVDQWEKYLSTLENKVESQGPVATIKFIEESIGL